MHGYLCAGQHIRMHAHTYIQHTQGTHKVYCLYATGFVKTFPKSTRTEIHFIRTCESTILNYKLIGYGCPRVFSQVAFFRGC